MSPTNERTENPAPNGPAVSNCAWFLLNPSSLTMEGRNNAKPDRAAPTIKSKTRDKMT